MRRTEPPMTICEIFDQLEAAPSDEARSEIFQKRAALRDHERPTRPTYDKKRRSFMQLMPRHIAWVEELAHRPERSMSPGRPPYDREFMQDNFTENYTRFFTPLRGSLAKAVPSDQLRISIMISSLLNLVDESRLELEEESAYAACYH
jgi:hypothetical protein